MKKTITLIVLFITLLMGCKKTSNIESISNITVDNIETMYITNSVVTSWSTYVKEEDYNKFYSLLDMKYEDFFVEDKSLLIKTYFFYVIQNNEKDVIFVYYLGLPYEKIELDKYIVIQYGDKYYISTKKNRRLFKATNDYINPYYAF